MDNHLETYTTPDGKYTVIIEVDWEGLVLSVIFEENDKEESIYE